MLFPSKTTTVLSTASTTVSSVKQTTDLSTTSTSVSSSASTSSLSPESTSSLTMDGYTVVKTLAPALEGDVILCVDNATGDQVAIKRVKLAAASNPAAMDSESISQVETAEKWANQVFSDDGGHRHILSMRTHFVLDGVEHLVFDYCSGGNLKDVVKAAGCLRNEAARRYLSQILSGVQYMHRRGVAHRDISLDNVLVDSDKNALVCDFGLSVRLPGVYDDCVGKWRYMAPEVISGQAYDPAKADVWSLGILLYRMLLGEFPLTSASKDDTSFCTLKTSGASKLVYTQGLAGLAKPQALHLLDRMLHPNPDSRFTIDAVMDHPYVRGPSSNN